jgi:hypothetical protein
METGKFLLCCHPERSEGSAFLNLAKVLIATVLKKQVLRLRAYGAPLRMTNDGTVIQPASSSTTPVALFNAASN